MKALMNFKSLLLATPRPSFSVSGQAPRVKPLESGRSGAVRSAMEFPPKPDYESVASRRPAAGCGRSVAWATVTQPFQSPKAESSRWDLKGIGNSSSHSTRLTENRSGHKASGGRFSNDRGDGPRGTPTVDEDRVYALGGNGDLSCFRCGQRQDRLESKCRGKVWRFKPPLGDQRIPLILGDRLLVNAGGPDASVVALRKKDGSVLWKSGSDRAGYSSAIAFEVAGIPQAVFFTYQRALAVDVRNGNLLWDYAQVANRTANIATPIAKGNKIFLSSDYGTGCALLEIKPEGTKLKAQEIYFNQNMKNHHSSSVLDRGYVVWVLDAILTAMRFDDGEVIWKDRSVGKGSLVFADGHLYCFSEKGVVGLVEATPKGYQEKGRFSIPQESLPTWSHPVVAGGRLYLRDQDNLFAFDVRAKK